MARRLCIGQALPTKPVDQHPSMLHGPVIDPQTYGACAAASSITAATSFGLEA